MTQRNSCAFVLPAVGGIDDHQRDDRTTSGHCRRGANGPLYSSSTVCRWSNRSDFGWELREVQPVSGHTDRNGLRPRCASNHQGRSLTSGNEHRRSFVYPRMAWAGSDSTTRNQREARGRCILRLLRRHLPTTSSGYTAPLVRAVRLLTSLVAQSHQGPSRWVGLKGPLVLLHPKGN